MRPGDKKDVLSDPEAPVEANSPLLRLAAVLPDQGTQKSGGPSVRPWWARLPGSGLAVDTRLRSGAPKKSGRHLGARRGESSLQAERLSSGRPIRRVT